MPPKVHFRVGLKLRNCPVSICFFEDTVAQPHQSTATHCFNFQKLLIQKSSPNNDLVLLSLNMTTLNTASFSPPLSVYSLLTRTQLPQHSRLWDKLSSVSVHLSEASVLHLDTSAASSILTNFYTTANQLSTVLWFNPTQQLSTAQLLAHSLHNKIGEKIRG